MRTRGAPSPAELVGRSGSISVVRDLAAAGLLDRLRLVVDPGVVGTWDREFAFAGHRRRIMELVERTAPDGRLSAIEYRQAPR